MIIEHTPFKPPNYDPYEECCVGGHDGEVLTITMRDGLKIIIKQNRSGIGDDYEIKSEYKGQTRDLGTTYIDDDGLLV